jgi:hypothetical protein
VVGIWITGEEAMASENLWAACSRLVICEEGLGSVVKSSSQDRNTFMVAIV